jgi:ubiquitin-like 1-activating enzyme E1 A
LVAGATALSAELCKNAVLAGVGALTLLDDATVTDTDLAANFLLDPATALGQNRAQAAVPRLQALNPRVAVRADAGALAGRADDFFAAFDVVCVVHRTAAELARVDDVCRARRVKFFAGDVFGLVGFVFCDLREHAYVECARPGRRPCVRALNRRGPGSARSRRRRTRTRPRPWSRRGKSHTCRLPPACRCGCSKS